MTITWQRDSESNTSSIARLGTRGTLSKDVPYIVLGAATEEEIHVAANAYISSNVPTWTYPNQPSVRLLAQSYDVDYLGDDAWRVVVHYERQGADDDRQQTPARASRSFDTSGGSRHTTFVNGPPGVVRKFAPGDAIVGGADASDDERAIGWDGEKVNGVDIIEPALNWTETYDVPSSYVTAAYIKSLAALTGSVNNAAFRSFSAGEVLLVGVSGAQDWDSIAGDGPWRLSYRFEARPNAGNDGDPIPPSQAIIGGCPYVKKGHHYLWVRYKKTVADNEIRPAVETIYVGQVYRETNFALLGIGTT